jgi:hypothetical protein
LSEGCCPPDRGARARHLVGGRIRRVQLEAPPVPVPHRRGGLLCHRQLGNRPVAQKRLAQIWPAGKGVLQSARGDGHQEAHRCQLRSAIPVEGAPLPTQGRRALLLPDLSGQEGSYDRPPGVRSIPPLPKATAKGVTFVFLVRRLRGLGGHVSGGQPSPGQCSKQDCVERCAVRGDRWR